MIRVRARIALLVASLGLPALLGSPIGAQAATSTSSPSTEPAGFQTLLHTLRPNRWTLNGGVENAGFGLDDIVVDWQDPRFTIATADGGGYYASTDGGRTWKVHDTPAGGIGTGAIWHRPGGPRWIYVAGDHGLWRSADDGRTWTKIRDETGDVRIISDTILFSTSGWVRRGSLPAEDWHSYQIPEPRFGLVYEWSHDGHETIITMPTAGPGHERGDQYSLYTKQDGGQFRQVTWPGERILDLFAIPGTSTVIAAGYRSTLGDDGGLWRSTDAGQTWTTIRVLVHRGGGLVRDGESTADAHCCNSFYTVEPLRIGGRLVLFSDGAGGGSVASYDDGLTWHAIDGSTGLGFVLNIGLVRAVPESDGLYFIATGSSSSLWGQLLPGLQAQIVLTSASSGPLDGNSDDLLLFVAIGGGLLVLMAIPAVWWRVRRRPQS